MIVIILQDTEDKTLFHYMWKRECDALLTGILVHLTASEVGQLNGGN